jgi:hypothetical protein
MTIEITIQVPDALGQQLQQLHDRLPEALERGLREIGSETTATPHDEQSIIAILTSQPTPEQVLAIRPSPELQARASELQSRSNAGTLTTQERSELDRVLLLEHMVRMAKAHCVSTSRRTVIPATFPQRCDSWYWNERRGAVSTAVFPRRLLS